MNILQLMPQFPFPAVDGGKVGLANIALQFAKQGHTVHLVCYRSANSTQFDEWLRLQGIYVHAVEFIPSNSAKRIARSMFTHRSLYMFKHATDEMNELIDDVIGKHSIDVIHADHTCMAPTAMEAAGRHQLPWGYRLHNMEWVIWQRYAERFHVWNPAHWYLTSQASKVRREEEFLLSQAAVVFAITTKDAIDVQKLASRCIVVPAGVDPAVWKKPRSTPSDPQIVMASNYRWIHNVDALRWFIETVWVGVHKQYPNACFQVIGVNVPDWVANYSSIGVARVGFVHDLAEHYSAVTLSVAPLFVGSGMRIKIVEAMAAALPVVTTTIGAEGIDLDEKSGLIRIHESDEMIAEICRLIADPVRCERLGMLAQDAVTRLYTWENGVRGMLTEYARLTTKQ